MLWIVNELNSNEVCTGKAFERKAKIEISENSGRRRVVYKYIFHNKWDFSCEF